MGTFVRLSVTTRHTLHTISTPTHTRTLCGSTRERSPFVQTCAGWMEGGRRLFADGMMLCGRRVTFCIQ